MLPLMVMGLKKIDYLKKKKTKIGFIYFIYDENGKWKTYTQSLKKQIKELD
jgi:hypothetical protein